MSNQTDESLLSSLDIKDANESAAVTMFGRDFQVIGAVQQKDCAKKLVLWNTMDSSGTVECKEQPQTCCDETDEVGRCLCGGC